MVDLNEIEKIFNDIIIWVQNNVFSIDNIIDGVLLLLIYLIAIYIYKKSFPKINKLVKKIKFITVQQKNKLINIILKPLIYMFLVWIYVLIVEITGFSHFFSSIAANLLTAWVFIKLITTFLPDKFYVKILSYVIWAVAVLKILNIYERTISILESLAFKSGNLEISVLLVIKGFIMFIIFFWLARKINEFSTKRIEKSDELTPSIKVLIKKLTKFGFYTIAFLITLSSIGVNLSTFAFLGGAIGVGLGFGLQKIVSNFISGIIILLDKSIKPGDVVEINDVYGRVKSLDTRFVSIVTLAGKEYLITNENFITKEVINWSYSDELIRVDITVGVGYDSNMKMAKKLLLKSLENKERIVNKPSPMCLMTEFADNTVNFSLRFWIKDPDNGIANIKSEVLFDVWNLFADNNINISFPQLDLHLQTMSEEMLTKLKKIFSQNNLNKEESITEVAAAKEEIE